MNMCDKFIKWCINKFWDTDVFQEEIVKRINERPVEWVWRNFNKIISNKAGYTIVHSNDQMIPLVFISEQEVRNKVAEWDKTITDYKEKTEPKVEEKPAKPKRKYTKRKKDGDSGKKNS